MCLWRDALIVWLWRVYISVSFMGSQTGGCKVSCISRRYLLVLAAGLVHGLAIAV